MWGQALADRGESTRADSHFRQNSNVATCSKCGMDTRDVVLHCLTTAQDLDARVLELERVAVSWRDREDHDKIGCRCWRQGHFAEKVNDRRAVAYSHQGILGKHSLPMTRVWKG